MLERARVYLDEGHIFGEEGEGFERMNIACPRPVLREALDRIQQAVHAR
jgi:cystathionine beta-lyase